MKDLKKDCGSDVFNNSGQLSSLDIKTLTRNPPFPIGIFSRGIPVQSHLIFIL